MKVRPAALIIRNNCLLTLRYRYGTRDVFMLPGGNVDPGETLPQTIERELNEELGIQVKVQEFLGIGEVVSWFDKEDVLHCFFSASVTEGIPSINHTQCSAIEICWISKEEILSKVFYPNIAVQLADYLTGRAAFGYTGLISQPEIH